MKSKTVLVLAARWMLVLAALLSFSPAARAQAGASGYRVEIDAPRDLRVMLEQGLTLNRWRTDPDMTPELLQRLLEEALAETREAVATRGWFSAAVTGAIERDTEPWTVRISVEPGPRTIVRGLDINVLGPAASDSGATQAISEARREFLLRPGQPFSQDLWQDAKSEAVRKLASWRYAAARVTRSEARVDPPSQSAELAVLIDSGPPFRFGSLGIIGNQRYPEQVVRNLSPLDAGQVYDHEKLRLYERRLQESGYFVSAQVSVEPDVAQAEAAPVRVSVIEGPPRSIEAGIGYNSDTALNTRIRFRNQDVFGSAWRFNSELRFDDKIQSVRADLDSPPRSDGSWNNHFASLREADVQKETTRELAAGFAHNWGWESTPSAVSVSGHTEDQTVQALGNANALYIGYRSTFRKTDDLIAPRAGYLGSINVGGAPPAFATREFVRATGRLLVFVPLGRRDDLLLRAEAGYVHATAREGIPSTFLFRTGGDQTVRGYAFQSLGVPLGDAIVGGRRLAIGSAEATHWFAEGWGMAAFVDAGDAWDSSSRGYKSNVGYGVGGRFRTPIGPVRADIAHGRETRQTRLHFSVGFTF